MYYEPGRMDHGLRHDPFKSLVVPRPIGWISTLDRDGVANLAPYSFFNAVSTNPHVVMFCPGARRASDPHKDARRNAEETGEFVVNIVTEALREQMNLTSAEFAPGVDEMARAGLKPLPSRRVKAPRVAGSPIHFECVYLQTVVLPSDDPVTAAAIVLGQVVGIHIDEAVMTDGIVDISKFRPIARLGGMDYTVVDNVFTMNRPDPSD
jgi:flavin reductase (DIM6/NTAB) family NADH-FMN oxidoreductase RutF